MSGSGHDDHGDGHGAGEIPETLDAVVALIDHDKIYEQYLMMSGKYKDALEREAVQEMIKTLPSKFDVKKAYAGLGDFYAALRGFDLAEENAEYGRTQAISEVKQLLNQMFKREGQAAGYGSNAGLRHALDRIKKGEGEKILETLRDQVTDSYLAEFRHKHLEEKLGVDLLDPKNKYKLAEVYAKAKDGEAVDHQENIVGLIYHEANEKLRVNAPEYAPAEH